MPTNYYKLDLASLPDDLYNKETDVKEWLALTTTSKGSFPPDSLNRVLRLDSSVELERINGISLWMIRNVLPFALPLLVLASVFTSIGFVILKAFLLYVLILASLHKFIFAPMFMKRYKRKQLSNTDIKDNQYLHTERNNQKYNSLQFIWPESVSRPALNGTPVIFTAIPHGAAPLGITCYPVWSKLFNDKLCHWTCAPVVLKLPIVSTFMKHMGYIPAKAKHIVDTLTKKEENVGVVLDGIAGMFRSDNDTEIASIKQRKGIIKIALRAGVPIVPTYGFGHTSLWKIVVDPFGMLEALSLKLDVSLTPFFGRWNWFLGPPQRVPLCVCIGEPVKCPQIDKPTQDDIDKYHSQLLKSYADLFECHKASYGWANKKLVFV
ncbi:hypothetical protein ACHAWT_008065 [Skeletonema menzelii]